MIIIKKWVKTHFENKQQLIDHLQKQVDDMYKGFKVDNNVNRDPKNNGRLTIIKSIERWIG